MSLKITNEDISNYFKNRDGCMSPTPSEITEAFFKEISEQKVTQNKEEVLDRASPEFLRET